MTSNKEIRTGFHDVPGAHLYYEVRGSGPLMLFLGAPMDATGFTVLADIMAAEYTVVTYDPRGISRTIDEDPSQECEPDLLASDVSSLISSLNRGPAIVFGSSGGSITALALATRFGSLVTRVIAHEPPLVELLPDVAQLRTAIDEMCAAYERGDPADAWGRFFALTGITTNPGATPAGADDLQHEANRGTMAAMPPVSETFFRRMVRPLTRYRPDIATLRVMSSRVTIGAGVESTGQLPHRAAAALAEAVNRPLVGFPGGHAGNAEHPQEFATVLREIVARVN